MFERKYEIEEISPTRIFVRNKSLWRSTGMDNVAKIIEGLNANGKTVTAALPFKNFVNAYDYLIIMK